MECSHIQQKPTTLTSNRHIKKLTSNLSLNAHSSILLLSCAANTILRETFFLVDFLLGIFYIQQPQLHNLCISTKCIHSTVENNFENGMLFALFICREWTSENMHIDEHRMHSDIVLDFCVHVYFQVSFPFTLKEYLNWLFYFLHIKKKGKLLFSGDCMD